MLVEINIPYKEVKKLIEQYTVSIENIKWKGFYLIDKEYWPNSKNSARYLEIETNIELPKGAFIKKVFLYM